MPDDSTEKKKPKASPAKKDKEPAADAGASPEEADTEEQEYVDYSSAVNDLVNSISQIAAPFIDGETISMVTVVAVSADGEYSRCHEIARLPATAGEDKAERSRIERTNESSRLQTAMALATQKQRLVAQLRKTLDQIDNA